MKKQIEIGWFRASYLLVMAYLIALLGASLVMGGDCDQVKAQSIDSMLTEAKAQLPGMRQRWETAQLLYEQQIRMVCRLDSIVKARSEGKK